MEASEIFAPSEIGPGEDPFAGSDFGDFEQDPEPAPEPAPEPGLPIVDREGQRVGPSPLEQEAQEQGRIEPSSESGAQATPAGAQTAPPAQDEGQGTPEPAPVSEPQSGPTPEAQAALDALKAQTAPAPDPDPDLDPTPASSGDSLVPPVPEPEPEPEAEASSAGKTTRRRYVVLRVVGPGKFEQLTWHVNADGHMVPKGTVGSKRQTVALARGSDEALKIGYAACGRPVEGVTLIAVAAAYFTPKPVRPKPPEPSRERLVIG